MSANEYQHGGVKTAQHYIEKLIEIEEQRNAKVCGGGEVLRDY